MVGRVPPPLAMRTIRCLVLHNRHCSGTLCHHWVDSEKAEMEGKNTIGNGHSIQTRGDAVGLGRRPPMAKSPKPCRWRRPASPKCRHTWTVPPGNQARHSRCPDRSSSRCCCPPLPIAFPSHCQSAQQKEQFFTIPSIQRIASLLSRLCAATKCSFRFNESRNR